MATINQTIKNKHIKRNKKSNFIFSKAVCLRVYTVSPKKPNSAVRKVTRVVLSNSKVIIAYIPGEGHTLQKYSTVLVRPGRVRDLPGVRYKLVPGKYDFIHNRNRKNKRSKYGVRKIK